VYIGVLSCVVGIASSGAWREAGSSSKSFGAGGALLFINFYSLTKLNIYGNLYHLITKKSTEIGSLQFNNFCEIMYWWRYPKLCEPETNWLFYW